MARKRDSDSPEEDEQAQIEPTHSESPFLVETLDQFKALAHPLRQRLLEHFATRPQTTKQIADQLGEKPTRLYHHVNALERAGFIHVVSTRPKRGTTEKYYSAVARQIRIDPSLLTGQESKVSIDLAGLGLVDGILDNLRAELGEVLAQESSKPSEENESIFAQFEVRASASELQEIRQKLDAFMREIQTETDAKAALEPDGEAQRLVIAWYPLRRKPH